MATTRGGKALPGRSGALSIWKFAPTPFAWATEARFVIICQVKSNTHNLVGPVACTSGVGVGVNADKRPPPSNAASNLPHFHRASGSNSQSHGVPKRRMIARNVDNVIVRAISATVRLNIVIGRGLRRRSHRSFRITLGSFEDFCDSTPSQASSPCSENPARRASARESRFHFVAGRLGAVTATP